MSFGVFGVTEGELLTELIIFITGLFGTDIWHIRLFEILGY